MTGTFDSVIAFAERIGMVPIALHKEQPGYVIQHTPDPPIGCAPESVWP